MKNIKSMLFIAMLMAVGVSSASAQQIEFSVEKGDTVLIDPECERYLTGERMSKWVYGYKHVVYQLGTKKFPTGVLLYNGAKIGILSWVAPECLNVQTRIKEDNPQTTDKDTATAVTPKDSIPSTVETDKPDKDSIDAKQKDDTDKPQEKKKSGYDRFTIGVRGGASSLLHSSIQGNWNCGFDAILDLQYAHYWTKEDRPIDLGIIAGLGLGYSQSALKVDYDSTKVTAATTSTTGAASNVDYTVVAKDVKETDRTLQLEVPVMFSLIHDNGLFFNVGPKFMIPLYSPYKQTVSKEGSHISAYFPTEGVTTQDNIVTGKYDGQEPVADNGIQFNINIMLTAEIGYEWILKSGNSLGLGAYANYCVYNSFKNRTDSKSLFKITEASEASIAQLDVLSATNTYANKLGYFDVGLKLAYHFNFPKKAKKAAAVEE
jgi:hypothetical protein